MSHLENRAVEEGVLYVVATPIGNLRDLSPRALDVLRQVDLIAAEDTRVTQKLLSSFQILTKTISLREHNERREAERIVELLRAGESVAQVSDAGTPAVSDPGALLVDIVREAGLRVVPIPGCSAVVTALSASGFTQPQFLFVGFLPAKTGHRKKALEALLEAPYSLVFYEAPHRIEECLVDLLTVFGPARRVVLARELTKTFETIHRCTLGEVAAWFAGDANQTRGEFVVVVEGAPEAEASHEIDPEALRVLQILLKDLPVKQAATLTAEISGANKKQLYEAALKLREGD